MLLLCSVSDWNTFKWFSYSVTVSITSVNEAVSRGETFSKIHLKVNIFLNLVLFSSVSLAQNCVYLIRSDHSQIFFFPSIGWHPFTMNRKHRNTSKGMAFLENSNNLFLQIQYFKARLAKQIIFLLVFNYYFCRNMSTLGQTIFIINFSG